MMPLLAVSIALLWEKYITEYDIGFSLFWFASALVIVQLPIKDLFVDGFQNLVQVFTVKLAVPDEVKPGDFYWRIFRFWFLANALIVLSLIAATLVSQLTRKSEKAFKAFMRYSSRILTVALIVTAYAFVWYTANVLIMDLTKHKTLRGCAEKYLEVKKDDEPIALFGKKKYSAFYYTSYKALRIKDFQSLTNYIDSEKQRRFVIFPRKYLRSLIGMLHRKAKKHQVHHDEHFNYILISIGENEEGGTNDPSAPR